jgi:hypothetical protein
LAVFLNKAVIAVDQDVLGVQGTHRASWAVAAVPAHIADNTMLQGVDRASQDGNAIAYAAGNGTLQMADVCFSVDTCGRGDGVPIIAYHCVTDSNASSCPANQAFDLISTSGGMQVRSRWSQKCLELDGHTAQLMQQSCLNSSHVAGSTQEFGMSDDPRLCLVSHPDTCVGIALAVTQVGEVWARPLAAASKQARAVLFFNRDSQTAQAITVTLSSLDLQQSSPAQAIDLWPAYSDGCLLGTDMATCVTNMTAYDNITAVVQPHGVLMVTVQQTV